MILLRKKKWLLGLAFALLMMVFGGVFAYEVSRIHGYFSFDLMDRLGTYDGDLRVLERGCHRTEARFCFDTVVARSAWTSEFSPEDKMLLRKGCNAGDQRACRHLQAINTSSERFGKVWQFLPPSEGSDSTRSAAWPRISFIEGHLSYSDWLEILYQGVRDSEGPRSVDLVCGRTLEFAKALVCASYGSLEINLALSRVAAVIEQGGRVQPLAEHRDSPLIQFWQGYDLQRKDFEFAVNQLSRSSELHSEESKLWSIFLAKPWDMLLTFNVFSVFSGIPSHEFLHGIYFSSSEYQKMVSKIILTSPLKMLPLRSFVGSLYKTENDFVIHNEIQAYAMQSELSFPSSKDWLNAVRIFREPVQRFLQQESRWSDLVRNL